jgi:quercetin dioxygenase-like cupin family protein
MSRSRCEAAVLANLARRSWSIACMAGVLFASASAAELNPQSVEFQTPRDIHWVRNAAGTNEEAVLFGDPGKEGPYVIRIKWLPGHFSHPHFHNSDRFFAVISGTWWVGTGTSFDPNATVPIPAGSYVLHKAGQVHFDGAKNEETIIQVTGFGPVVTTPAEKP